MCNITKTAEKKQPNNQETMEFLKQQGYGFPEIRSAMFTLNGKTIPTVSKRVGVTYGTMYNVIEGISKNVIAISGFADEFNLDIKKAFSDIIVPNT